MKSDILQLLRSGDDNQRIQAARLLQTEECVSSEMIESLRNALDDTNPDVVCLVAHKLANIGDIDSLDYVYRSWERYLRIFVDPPYNHSPVAVPALDASLHKLMILASTDKLIGMLQQSRITEKIKAAEILGHRKAREAISALMTALDDRHDGLAIIAARSLLTIGDSAAKAPIYAAYLKCKERCRHSYMHSDERRLIDTFFVYAQMMNNEEIAEVSQNGDSFERAICILVIGQRHVPGALKILQAAQHDEDPEVRSNAVSALKYYNIE